MPSIINYGPQIKFIICITCKKRIPARYIKNGQGMCYKCEKELFHKPSQAWLDRERMVVKKDRKNRWGKNYISQNNSDMGVQWYNREPTKKYYYNQKWRQDYDW